MIDIGADLQRAFDEGYERGKADRPQGEWIIENAYYHYYTYRCSNCDWYEIRPFHDCDTFNYCPNCGADMRGADDE